ncbi:MAG: hypothetical protein KZQ84_19180 [Candidatus Thiodiazotropha sp. (ex Lucinoma borealis)]|nr:hypothetical protein [Candidatus Thiodiazotropha sp. (ex Lucinoma borealis)]
MALSEGFTHVIFNNDGQQASSTLHVYLGGDGTPWMGGFLIARDPTPRNPVGLALMALDKAPSIYLGRPCYHGQSRQSPCIPALWTSARYSSQVVDSMALALRGVMDDFDYSILKIFGFSGGGTSHVVGSKVPRDQRRRLLGWKSGYQSLGQLSQL